MAAHLTPTLRSSGAIIPRWAGHVDGTTAGPCFACSSGWQVLYWYLTALLPPLPPSMRFLMPCNVFPFSS